MEEETRKRVEWRREGRGGESEGRKEGNVREGRKEGRRNDKRGRGE